MISEKVKERFLNEKRDNFDWMKKAPRDEILDALEDLDPIPVFSRPKPWLHQLVCFLLIITLERFMCFLDMGGGKTRLTLMILSYRKQRGETVRAIVFVPYLTAIETWLDEVETHAPNLTIVPLMGSSKENLDWIKNEPGDIYVMTYQTAAAMCSKRLEVFDKGGKRVKTKTGRKKIEWNFAAAGVRKIFKEFDTLVMDEIHKIKNKTSLYYRLCWAISTSPQCKWAFGLTGTPFGKEPLDLWAQFHVIDLGDTLHENMGFFREVFYTRKDNFWGGFKWVFKRRLKKELHRIIKNRSIRYEITECADLPPRNYVPKYVQPTEGIQAYYNASVQRIEDLRKNRSKENYGEIESNWHRIRQLSSGFMTLKDADPGSKSEKHFVALDENPKMEALKELIDTMPEGRKMIIFHDYVFTNKLISDELKRLKLKHARIWGGQKDPIGELRRFKQSTDVNFLVINTASGSSSLNLQCAEYIVFFEQPTNAIDREQAERRVWRPGLLWPVFIFDLMMRGTKDEDQRQSNIDGHNLLRAVIDGRTKIERMKIAA